MLYRMGRAPQSSPSPEVKKIHKHRRRPQCRDGYRLAAGRALTGAGLYRKGVAPTLRAAALRTGSNVAYVAAGLVLLKAENTALIADVVMDRKSFIGTAKAVKQLGKLVAAYRSAS